MIDTLQDCYKGRLCKMFVVNANFVIRILWGIVETLMDPNTRAKICLTSNSTCKELQEWAHPSQLLKEYGGTADPPKAFWPPVFPPGPTIDGTIINHMSTEEFKEELLKNPQLMPSPDLASFVRDSRKGKSKKGAFPRKEFIMTERVERRDSFNGIISEVKEQEVTNVPKEVVGAFELKSEAKERDIVYNEAVIEKAKPEIPESGLVAQEEPNKLNKKHLSPSMGHLSKIEIEIQPETNVIDGVPIEPAKKVEDPNINVKKEISKVNYKETDMITSTQKTAALNEEKAVATKIEDELALEDKSKKVKKEPNDKAGCQCLLL